MKHSYGTPSPVILDNSVVYYDPKDSYSEILQSIYINMFIYMGVGKVWFQLLGGQGEEAYVILGLYECICNAPCLAYPSSL